MTDPTPTQELRAAAALLREKAALAAPGSWRRRGHGIYMDGTSQSYSVDADTAPYRVTGYVVGRGTAVWIALMDPVMGEALAEVLEREADVMGPLDAALGGIDEGTWPTLRLARRITAASKAHDG